MSGQAFVIAVVVFFAPVGAMWWLMSGRTIAGYGWSRRG